MTSLQVLGGELKELRGDLDTRKYFRTPPNSHSFLGDLGFVLGKQGLIE